MAFVSPEVDKCIECGFCESKCPSRRLTLTPRQRIVVQREISRLRTIGSDIISEGDSSILDSVIDDFTYDGIDTCAIDGLCATACPVSINTGDLTRRLRAESVTARGEQVANLIAGHFSLTETVLGIGVRLGHLAQSIIGVDRITSIIQAAEKITGSTLPKWNAHIPYSDSKVSRLWTYQRNQQQAPFGEDKSSDSTQYIYFPSCISRQLGIPKSDSRISSSEYRSLIETLITIAKRANISLHIPKDISGTCCGMPFHSKGYTSAYQASLHKAITKFWEWSDHGNLSIVIDTTSCAHTLRTCSNDLSSEDLALYRQMTVLDSIEFLHDTLLPNLNIHPIDEDIMLHPNCSAQKLGLQDKLVGIARQCARTAGVPLSLGCCGFAGDRGLLFPELTASATGNEAAEVNSRDYGGYYSSNIPCEIGMSEATGKDYISIVYLVEGSTRRSQENAMGEQYDR